MRQIQAIGKIGLLKKVRGSSISPNAEKWLLGGSEMLDQLFDKLRDSLISSLARLNEGISHPSRQLGLATHSPIPNKNKLRAITINYPGRTPEVTLSFNQQRIEVSYPHHEKFTIGYAEDAQQQTGSFWMEGRKWSVEGVSKKVLAPLIESLGG